jgi:DNA-binding response OmpR family regulator
MYRILVVEDEVSIGTSIVEILELYHHQPVWVCSGQKALDQLQGASFDLMLCDINLPDMDGYQILSAVRKDQRLNGLPFVFLTAYAGDHEVRMGMGQGADDYITKPFAIATLMAGIESVMRQRRNA